MSSDPGASCAEGQRIPGADGGGPAAGQDSPGDAAVGEGGGAERQGHPEAAETAEGGRAHPGGSGLFFASEGVCGYIQ